MELKQIKELMAAMGRTGIKRLAIKKENFELSLERDTDGPYISQILPEELNEAFDQTYAKRRAGQALSRGSEMPSGLASSAQPPPELPKEEISSVYITSPMVGTFYTAASPDDMPFIKVGDKVDKSQVVCIIEAMKVMNEIKAGLVGTVLELLVETGHPVEFGTKLFRITKE